MGNAEPRLAVKHGADLAQLVLNKIDFLALCAKEKLLVKLSKLRKKMTPEGAGSKK